MVDKRADVWAFGAVLYEMLTGTRVFAGGDVSDTLAYVLTKEIDWTTLPAKAPTALRHLLRRCLARDPKRRLRDIGDAWPDLEAHGVPPTELAARGGTSQLQIWQRPVGIAVAVLASLAVGGVGVWSLTRPAPPPPELVTRFPIPLAADQGFTFTSRRTVALSPDGSQVVYVANESLWLRPVDQLQAVQVPGTEVAGATFFSADGQSIGFWAGRQLQKVAVSGGAPVTITDAPIAPFGASWGADDMILYGQPEGIMQVPGASGTPKLLIPVNEGERILGPQMLPGDEWVLFTVRLAGQMSWDEAQIVAQSVTTNERMVLIDGGRDGRYLPTGHLVYGLNNVLFAVPFDVDSLEVTGGPVPLVEGVRRATSAVTGAMQFGVSTNGSLVYIPGSSGGDDVVTLTWVGRDGVEERIPVPRRMYGRPRVSPDGTRVAVDISEGDNRNIWIWDLAEESLTQITFDEADDNYVLWTPDSARVVFASSRDGGGVFWKAADGTGQVERLKDGLARPYAWTADGRLVFQQAQDIGVLTMEGERTVEMLFEEEYGEQEPAMSPDGRWLAYLSIETDRRVLVKPFPNIGDGLWNVSVDHEGVQPMWSPDGRELFYRNIGNNLMVAQVETEPTFSSRTPEVLFDLNRWGLRVGPALGRQFGPDGRA